jgi:hypothetical protein
MFIKLKKMRTYIKKDLKCFTIWTFTCWSEQYSTLVCILIQVSEIPYLYWYMKYLQKGWRVTIAAASTSETTVSFYQTAWCNIPEDCLLHTHHRVNLKTHHFRRRLLFSSAFKNIKVPTRMASGHLFEPRQQSPVQLHHYTSYKPLRCHRVFRLKPDVHITR